MKYLIFNGEFDTLTPILFPNTTKHSQIAFLLEAVLGRPVAAGFVNRSELVENGVKILKCWGNAVSLNLESNPTRDAKLIEQCFDALI